LRTLALAVGVALWLRLGAVAQADTLTLDGGEFRAIELAAQTDPEDFARRNGIADYEVRPLSGGTLQLRFPMEEGVWRARRAALCTDRGVQSCDTDYCQHDLGDANAAMPSPLGEPATATPAPPVAASTDHATPLLSVKVQGEDGQPRANTRVLLLPHPPDVAMLFPGAADTAAANPDTVPGPASCANPQRGRSVMPLVNVSRADGSVSFEEGRGPGGDRSCWDVVAVEGCSVRREPLSNYGPDFEPRRVLVLLQVPAADTIGQTLAALTAFATANQMRVLEATALPSIARTLVRLEIVNPQTSLDAAIALLGPQAGVELAQREYRYEVAAHSDPFAWMNYGARLSGADALQRSVSGKGVAVVVIDTGIDAAHPELAGRVTERIDVTGYGISADRHGTAVAGLIGAAADNGVGAYGMAPEAQIISIKACEPESRGGLAARCWSSSLAKALDAALARPVHIINMSLGGPKDAVLERLVNAVLSSSRLIVAAAGNGGPDGAPSYPAAYAGVLAVGAIDSRERPWAQATRGGFIALSAPGVAVPVPVPGESYPAQLSGTSMAAAHVSGVAALLQGAKPDATGAALRDALVAGGAGAGSAAAQPHVNGCAAAARLGIDTSGCTSAPPAAGRPP
jgi:hypothetical protein